jgi:hypothetical protein
VMAVVIPADRAMARGGPKVVFLPETIGTLGKESFVARRGQIVGDHAAEVGRLGAIEQGNVIGHVALAFDEPEHVLDVVLGRLMETVAKEAQVGEVGCPSKRRRNNGPP